MCIIEEKMTVFHFISFINYLYKVKVRKGIDLQTCPVFTLITRITRKKLIAIKMKRKTE